MLRSVVTFPPAFFAVTFVILLQVRKVNFLHR